MIMAADSGSEAAGESRLSCTASPRLVVVPARDVLDKSVDEGNEAPPSATLWADVPADILGVVLRLLPCVADRASMRSVCRHWRAAAHVQALPAPLPVVMLPRLIAFSSLTSDGALTAARRALTPIAADLAVGNDVQNRILGSCDDWLMVERIGDHQCFLLKAFSSEVVHLPHLQSNAYYRYSCLDEFSRAHPAEGQAWLLYSALSASPSSVSNYTVAALTYGVCGPDGHDPGLALWQPGMTSWYLCRSSQINTFSCDLAFYQGKLYMVQMRTPDILAFHLREDEHGVSLSCPGHYNISPLIPSKTTGRRRCNLVVWRGKLLLIIRFFRDSSYTTMDYKSHIVEVFALDFSSSPCGVTKIHNFDGDCIFVQKCGCKSFSAGLHVGVQGDLIYFLDEGLINHVSYTYVHNMRDGTLRRIADGLRLPNYRPAIGKQWFFDFPVWVFPS